MKTHALLLMFCLLLASLAARSGEPPAALPPNAALQYWKAFSFLNLSPQEKESLLGKHAADQFPDELVKRLESPLLFLRRGAEIHACDWGIDTHRDGAETLLPHISKCRELARVSLSIARHHFNKKEHEKGLVIVLDVLALARHTSGGYGMMSKLIEFSITDIAAEILSMELPRLPQPLLKSLAGRLDALPKGMPVEASVRGERHVYEHIFKQAEGDLETLRAKWRENRADKTQLAMLDAIDTPEKRTAMLARLNALYDAIEKSCTVPYSEFQSANREIERQAAECGAFEALIPTFDGLRFLAERRNARWAMIHAASQFLLEGEEGLKKVQDPYGNGPFAFSKVVSEKGAAGFKLQSKLSKPQGPADGVVTTMTFGVPAEQPIKKVQPAFKPADSTF